MNERVTSKRLLMQILLCTLIFFAVFLIGLSNYLLYHTLAEMFGIVVSIAIFIIAWNTRKNLDNNAFLIIGVAYLFIGGIDLLHLLAYKGMGVFKTHDGNLPTQLWVSARLLQSISFLLAPFFVHRKVPAKAILFGYMGLTLLLIASIFYWKVFPVCFIEGMGLTPFKKVTEYVICLMLALSIVLFFKNRQAFDETVLWYIMASVCLTIISEVSLTLYVHPYSLSNFMGHYFKIISFYLIYKAIIEIGLQRPYDVLFRNLKQNENALSESEAKYRSMMEAMQDPVYIASQDFTVSYMNPAMISWIGRDAIGEHCYKALNGYDRKCDFCDFHEISRGGLKIKETFRQKDGRYYHVTHSPVYHVDGSVSKLTIFRDITEIKQIELECRQERDKARLYLDIVGSMVIVLNPDQTVALINKKGCELLETDEKDIVGKKWFDTFVPEKDREAAKSVFREIMSGEIQSSEFFENMIMSRKNNEKLISWHNSILRDENGMITGTLSSGEDITASRKLQNDLLWESEVNRKAKEELEIRVKERTNALSETNRILVNEIEERKTLAENLLRSETELKNLSAKRIQSYEEERRRIGEELHDGLAQTLSAIKVWSDAAIARMENNKPEESMESIRSILTLAKTSVSEVRNIIKNLRPTVLDDLGLEAAVSWLCQEFEKTHSQIVLKRKINLINEQIPESLKIVIFRITQEALNNVSKHSGANLVSVLLNQCPDTIELTVHDNGIGFNIDDALNASQPMERGLGLTSMEERAKLSGGVFSIVASPAKGAMVRVIWKI